MKVGCVSRRRLSADANHSSVAKRTCAPALQEVALLREWAVIRVVSCCDGISLAAGCVWALMMVEEVVVVVLVGVLVVCSLVVVFSDELLRTLVLLSSNRRPDTLSRWSRVVEDFCII